MERLVIRVGSDTAVPCKFDLDFAIDLDKKTWNGLKEIFDALADVYDILGENYNLDRLRELAEADKDGRCLILNKKLALTPKGKNPVWILRDNGIIQDYIVDAWLCFDRDGNLFCVYSTKSGIDIVENAVGNTVFLSQEAAEAALKERRGDEG